MAAAAAQQDYVRALRRQQRRGDGQQRERGSPSVTGIRGAGAGEVLPPSFEFFVGYPPPRREASPPRVRDVGPSHWAEGLSRPFLPVRAARIVAATHAHPPCQAGGAHSHNAFAHWEVAASHRRAAAAAAEQVFNERLRRAWTGTRFEEALLRELHDRLRLKVRVSVARAGSAAALTRALAPQLCFEACRLHAVWTRTVRALVGQRVSRNEWLACGAAMAALRCHGAHACRSHCFAR